MKRTVLVVAVVVAILGLGALAASAAPTYIGAEKCKMCHNSVAYNKLWDSWKASKHANALQAAKASTQPKYDAACLTCHATNNDETLAGVQCEACHGPGSDYKLPAVMKDRAKAIANGLIVPDQKTCDTCHDGKDHHKKQAFTKDVHAHKAAAK